MKPYNCDLTQGKVPANYHNYICDVLTDLDTINLKETCPGSTAIVMKPVYKEYILGVDYKWHPKTINTSGGSSSGVSTDIEEIPSDILNEMLDQYLPLNNGGTTSSITEISASTMNDLLNQYLPLSD